MGSILDDIKGEFHKSNNIVIKLILMNVLVFVSVIMLFVTLKWSSQDALLKLLTDQLFLPADFRTFIYRPWTLLTNFFIHIDPFHIFFNMLILYWFGRVLEEYLGSRRFWAIYLYGGLAGGLLFLLMYNLVPYFQSSLTTVTLLGASGAIYAIIVAAATLLPDYTFFVFLLGPIRLKYIAAIFLIISLAQLVGPNAGGNLAHLAGGMIGFGFIKALQAGRDWGTPIYAISGLWKRVTSPKPRVEIPQRERATTSSAGRRYASTTEPNSNSTPNQDEIDAILDKISKSGYASLTREEKQKLYRASQQQ
jgi:membrane associated rhomboid family serine protease